MRPALLDLASRLAARGEGFALVTVVRREPPSSARVGDTALVTRNGEVHGWVGGGCTRATLLRESLRAIADGEPRLLSLSTDPASEERPGLVALPMTCKSGGTVDLYVEPVLPVPRVVVFGTTPAARTVVRIAHAIGYRVDVVDPEADGGDFPEATRVIPEASPDAIPQGAWVLVATMDERDLDAIAAVASLNPAYLGVIASRKRFAELRDALAARGVPRSVLDAIAAPAGLVGAREVRCEGRAAEGEDRPGVRVRGVHQPPAGDGAGDGSGALLRSAQPDVPVRQLHLRRGHRPRHRRGQGPAVRGGRRLRQHHQPDDRRRADPRRPRAGDRAGALRGDQLRRGRQHLRRQLHGLLRADRRGVPGVGDRQDDHALAAPSARREGGGRVGDGRRAAGDRERGDRCAAPSGGDAHRHPDHAGQGVAAPEGEGRGGVVRGMVFPSSNEEGWREAPGW